MKNFKSLIGRVLTLFLIVTVCILLIKLKINGSITALTLHDYKFFLPMMLFIPLSHLIWGRMICQTFDLESFESQKWERLLNSYGATTIVNDHTKKVYKVPFSKLLMPAQISMEWRSASVVITAPKRVFYDFGDT